MGSATRSVTIAYEDATASVPAAVDGDALWIAPADLERGLGWTLKPAGLCRGSLCVPLPAGREGEGEMVRADGSVDLAAVARYRGQPAAHDDARSVWVFGEPAERRTALGESLEAPDFTLPDQGGRMHSLSAARGRKVLLASWASW